MLSLRVLRGAAQGWVRHISLRFRSGLWAGDGDPSIISLETVTEATGG